MRTGGCCSANGPNIEAKRGTCCAPKWECNRPARAPARLAADAPGAAGALACSSGQPWLTNSRRRRISVIFICSAAAVVSSSIGVFWHLPQKAQLMPGLTSLLPHALAAASPS